MTGIRTMLLAVVPPVVGAAASVAVILTLDLPERIAVHWGTDGVDRLSTVGELIGPMVVFVAITTAVAIAALAFGSRGARSTVFGRTVVGVSNLIGLGIAFASLALALAQVGVADVTSVSVGTTLGYMGIGFAAALVLAIAFAALTPRTAVSSPTNAAALALDLGATERASWSRSVSPSRTVLGILVAIVVALIVTLTIAGAPFPLTVGTVVLVLAVVGLLFWRVTVDARGIIVRPALGVPRFRVEAADVVAARAIDVDPVRQFGGWGIRVGAAGWGVVVRGGSAVEVERAGRSPFIVTVDDAETAAALLTAVARRA